MASLRELRKQESDWRFSCIGIVPRVPSKPLQTLSTRQHPWLVRSLRGSTRSTFKTLDACSHRAIGTQIRYRKISYKIHAGLLFSFFLSVSIVYRWIREMYDHETWNSKEYGVCTIDEFCPFEIHYFTQYRYKCRLNFVSLSVYIATLRL